ncbi:MAG: radical SAM protein [Desulfobulbaceae bacterium]|uniref:Radical SAM protein n=1 Tax=Candidatus Desulfobia pelagia TaxID=2841692 RepID=A0A8J6TBV0_9BACT|nr:radical SAM protein [Candidatus Desulfobia pelagia]
MKYTFGPVNSRRLGLSLGIDLLAEKTCSYNCIYCEIGVSPVTTCDRKEYTPTAEIIAEIDETIKNQSASKPIDIFTITGNGEPTLHSGLGKIIHHIKERTDKPVAVLTNGSLFYRADVRKDLFEADIVIPSLDAARESSFRKINRPAACNRLSEIIDGLVLFSREFSGKIWLEILIVKGINNTPEDITALQQAVARIKPDMVQLNTVARPPLEKYAMPVSQEELKRIAQELPGKVEIIADFSRKKKEKNRIANESEILHILQRRPCTASDICEALNLDTDSTTNALLHLEKSEKVIQTEHQGKKYYSAP